MTANYRDFNNQEFVKGLNFDLMSSSQKDNLIDLIKVYTSRFSEEYAKTYDQEMISHGFENTTFAWAGSTKISEGHYYFIKHDKFLIEYDNTQNDANTQRWAHSLASSNTNENFFLALLILWCIQHGKSVFDLIDFAWNDFTLRDNDRERLNFAAAMWNVLDVVMILKL